MNDRVSEWISKYTYILIIEILGLFNYSN